MEGTRAFVEMTQRRFPAVFMRGGTSKAIMFHARDLPAARGEWDAIFLSAMGSPDPNGRQLDGMGGGVSSLSKVCVIAPSQREDADIDYTFAQVQVKQARVDYASNCGNMSSAVGPFALEEGLVPAAEGEAMVRIFNTNTRKIIHSSFGARGGRALVEGKLAIPGVAGTGAPIRLDFVDPGGATTGKLLPSGNASDVLDVQGFGGIEVSMVDAANACVFLAADALGLKGTEMPDELERNAAVLEALAAIRLHASVAMGIARTLDEARERTAVPFIGFVSPAQDARTLSDESFAAAAADLTVRMISNGQPHRALPLTASLCAAVAARIDGSVVWKAARRNAGDALRLAMPSGVLTVGAEASRENGAWRVARGSFYRTARRLFEGYVYA
jgi:2-methylaconitate cis-trans-isomerase PrpF